MGGRSSRIISYEDACNRLGDGAVAAIEEGFRRLCTRPRGLAPMDSTTFRRDVLADLPQMVCAASRSSPACALHVLASSRRPLTWPSCACVCRT